MKLYNIYGLEVKKNFTKGNFWFIKSACIKLRNTCDFSREMDSGKIYIKSIFSKNIIFSYKTIILIIEIKNNKKVVICQFIVQLRHKFIQMKNRQVCTQALGCTFLTFNLKSGRAEFIYAARLI